MSELCAINKEFKEWQREDKKRRFLRRVKSLDCFWTYPFGHCFHDKYSNDGDNDSEPQYVGRQCCHCGKVKNVSIG